MQQKVSIARALLTSPVMLLLDEPTTGLDPRSKKDVQKFIRDLRAEHEATILLTSHDMDEADALCDRLAILDGGRIVVEGTPQQLKEDFARRHELDRMPTLEEVFMEYTGRSLDEDFEMDEGGSE
jgi:ABC-2 type transport system ATP-binding protein